MADRSHQDALLASIRQAAEIERERIVAEAAAEVARIEAQADADVAAIEADARERATHTADFETDRALAKTEAHTRQALAQRKRQLLDEAFALARTQLESRDPGDGNLQRKLLDEALAVLGPQARESDEPLTAVSADGRRRVDNRLLTRLERVKTLHSQDIAVLLFGVPGHA
jgi:vacuolar-type H+-ATPase subunit E/Vma4